MIINTKHFGTIEIDDNKIITFEQGIVGFEELKNFTILYDGKNEKDTTIAWFQSIEEPVMALPVIPPALAKEDYSADIPDELLEELGPVDEDLVRLLVTLAVPQDLTKMTCNLCAPLVINTQTRKGAQVILDGSKYPIKYPVYERFLKIKEQKGVE